MPDGYRRVLNTKTGNTEVVSSDGVFYFETANGLRPKAGGNLAGLVEAERRGEGPKEAAKAVSPIVPGGGLAAHEAAGGHLIAKHVGQSEAQLLSRLSAEPKITGSSSFYDQIIGDRPRLFE